MSLLQSWSRAYYRQIFFDLVSNSCFLGDRWSMGLEKRQLVVEVDVWVLFFSVANIVVSGIFSFDPYYVKWCNWGYISLVVSASTMFLSINCIHPFGYPLLSSPYVSRIWSYLMLCVSRLFLNEYTCLLDYYRRCSFLASTFSVSKGD